MPHVLYRKYRPASFAEVAGQDVITRILQNSVKSGRVTHAYLFAGPRGVGKTTLARVLAKAVNCLKLKDGEPDLKCANCVSFQGGRFLDLIEIDAASYTGVENVREIIEHVGFSPSVGKYKVFIIDEVHMLSKAAFNALLKTLEEPPAHAIFILATTEVGKVPPTIISRAQRFDFRAVSQEQIEALLGKIISSEKLKVSRDAQALIARAAGGSFRDALSILDQITSFHDKEVSLAQAEEILGVTRIEFQQKFFDFLVRKDRSAAVNFVREIAFAGKDLPQFTSDFLEYLRTILYVKTGGDSADETIRAQAEAVTAAELLALVKTMIAAYRDFKQSPVAEMPLLTAVLSATQGERPAIRQVEEKPPAKTAANLDSVDLGSIVDRWGEVLSRVREYNHSLLSSLRLGRIVEAGDGGVVLAFPYSFHKENVEARKNRIVIEQVLEDVFGKKLKIKVVLERETQGENLLDEAVKILGKSDDQSAN